MSHTNYNAMSNKKGSDKPSTLPETVTNATVHKTPDNTTQSEPIFGFVTGCARLNVRKEPNINAPILLTIVENTDVIIVLEESTAEWYKVYANEQEGFCKKKFIEIDE